MHCVLYHRVRPLHLPNSAPGLQVQELQLSPSPLDHSVLCGLWEEGVLCDVVCKARDGTESKAHKVGRHSQFPPVSFVWLTSSCHILPFRPARQVVLAAASPFFRALFAGTGAVMQEVRPSCNRPPTWNEFWSGSGCGSTAVPLRDA